MPHGDDAPTSIEVVDVARGCAGQPSQQEAARPRRRKPTRHIGFARVTGSQTDLHRAVRALLDGGAHAADIHTDYGPHARTHARDVDKDSHRHSRKPLPATPSSCPLWLHSHVPRESWPVCSLSFAGERSLSSSAASRWPTSRPPTCWP